MKKHLSLVLIAIIVLFTLTACSDNDLMDEDFSFSDGLAENGYWEDVKALDHVELCDHERIAIPADSHLVTDEEMGQEIAGLLVNYAIKSEVTDRPVEEGDTINIDYVGSVDGVEFAGGSTGGQGAEVTIGVTSYIEGFLEQLVGHSPGETFDIEVTFPEDYGNADLDGKDAVFNITINHIVETEDPELTDDFIEKTFADSYGWTTIAELETETRENLQQEKINVFIEKYIVENSTVKSVPDSLVKYQNQAIIYYYRDYASQYQIEFEDFIKEYIGAESVDDLLEMHVKDSTETVNFYLILQAIAEDADITAAESDVSAFFAEKMNTDDYSELEELYGMPYLKLITLHDKITEYLEGNVILE